jgi:hypothetical protein
MISPALQAKSGLARPGMRRPNVSSSSALRALLKQENDASH